MKKTHLLFILSCFLFASCGTDKFASGGFAKRKYRDGIYVSKHDKTDALDKNKVNTTVPDKESEIAKESKIENKDSVKEKIKSSEPAVAESVPNSAKTEKLDLLRNKFFTNPMKSIVQSKKIAGAINGINSEVKKIKKRAQHDESNNWMGIAALACAVLAIIMLVLSYYALILLLSEVATSSMLIMFLALAFICALAAIIIGAMGSKQDKEGKIDRTFGVLSNIGMIIGIVLCAIMLTITVVVALIAALLSGI